MHVMLAETQPVVVDDPCNIKACFLKFEQGDQIVCDKSQQIRTITSLYLHEQVKREGGLRPTQHLTKKHLLQGKIRVAMVNNI